MNQKTAIIQEITSPSMGNFDAKTKQETAEPGKQSESWWSWIYYNLIKEGKRKGRYVKEPSSVINKTEVFLKPTTNSNYGYLKIFFTSLWFLLDLGEIVLWTASIIKEKITGTPLLHKHPSKLRFTTRFIALCVSAIVLITAASLMAIGASLPLLLLIVTAFSTLKDIKTLPDYLDWRANIAARKKIDKLARIILFMQKPTTEFSKNSLPYIKLLQNEIDQLTKDLPERRLITEDEITELNNALKALKQESSQSADYKVQLKKINQLLTTIRERITHKQKELTQDLYQFAWDTLVNLAAIVSIVLVLTSSPAAVPFAAGISLIVFVHLIVNNIYFRSLLASNDEQQQAHTKEYLSNLFLSTLAFSCGISFVIANSLLGLVPAIGIAAAIAATFLLVGTSLYGLQYLHGKLFAPNPTNTSTKQPIIKPLNTPKPVPTNCIKEALTRNPLEIEPTKQTIEVIIEETDKVEITQSPLIIEKQLPPLSPKPNNITSSTEEKEEKINETKMSETLAKPEANQAKPLPETANVQTNKETKSTRGPNVVTAINFVRDHLHSASSLPQMFQFYKTQKTPFKQKIDLDNNKPEHVIQQSLPLIEVGGMSKI